MPTFGSLFAGIGGIDLGLERAGWECRFQVEWDQWCRDRLTDRWPDVPKYGDIVDVDWGGVGRVDLLAGGFPCQPVSSAGKQKAQADARWLWPEFLRAIRHLRPGLVLVENVPNLLAVNSGSAFGDVLGDLAQSGYDTEWDCIPAAAVGAPHERDRVFLVAYPGRVGGERRGVAGDVRRTAGEAQGKAPERERGGNAVGDRGETMAYTPSDGRESRRASDAAQEPGRREPYRGDSGRTLANPNRARLQGRVFQPERAREWFAGTRGVGYPDGELNGTPRQTEEEAASAGRTLVPGVRGRAVGDADSAPTDAYATAGGPRGATSEPSGRRAEPRLGGDPHGLPSGLDHCWPAPPGPQYDWEPSRTVVGRVHDRTRRLKACGNAVVPQVVEVIGRQLLQAIESAA